MSCILKIDQRYQDFISIYRKPDSFHESRDCTEISKRKFTKVMNADETERKVPTHVAKSYDKTHQKNGQELSYSSLGTGIFNCRK